MSSYVFLAHFLNRYCQNYLRAPSEIRVDSFSPLFRIYFYFHLTSLTLLRTAWNDRQAPFPLWYTHSCCLKMSNRGRVVVVKLQWRADRMQIFATFSSDRSSSLQRVACFSLGSSFISLWSFFKINEFYHLYFGWSCCSCARFTCSLCWSPVLHFEARNVWAPSQQWCRVDQPIVFEEEENMIIFTMRHSVPNSENPVEARKSV